MLPWTTTITVETSDGDGDPYEPATATTTGPYPAHVGSPSGRDAAVGGDLEAIDATCHLPAGTPVSRRSVIVDAGTGRRYAVAWIQPRQGLGLDHLVVGMYHVAGGSNG